MDTALLVSMFQAAIAAIAPAKLVEEALRRRNIDPRQPVTVLAVGKAAAGMVWGAHRVLGDRMVGVAALTTESDLPPGISGFVGGHPVPNQASVVAGEALLAAAAGAPSDSLVLCLVSGGGSAVAEVPVPGVTIEDLAVVNRVLLDSGAAISEVNAVRRALSQIKGGGLASHVAAGQLLTLAISDVGAAGVATIASGPTLAAEIGRSPLDVLGDLDLLDVVPPRVLAAVSSAVSKVATPHEVEVIADGSTAARAAAAAATRLGLRVKVADRELVGEAVDEARRVVDDAQHAGVDVVVHVGETTVRVTGGGTGGRNHEAALAAAIELSGRPGAFLAAGTDGIDGLTDGAGAAVDGHTVPWARSRGIDPAGYLIDHDSGGFFDVVPGRIVTGPTGTNVADIWLMAAGRS